jgi:hypothetical protein
MAKSDRRRFLQAWASLPMWPAVGSSPFRLSAMESHRAGQRREILSRMQLAMGSFPNKTKPPLDPKTLDRCDLPTITRSKISYVSEEGDRVPAYLLKPKRLSGRLPGILCLHQTTVLGAAEPAGLSGDPNLHYALELAQRKYITLAPNYPNLPFTQGFGGYRYDGYRNGYLSTTMKGIWNHMRAVDLLQSLPEVNPNRIACIGHSLGGHNTLFAGAFDSRIRVLVSSCGFTSFAKYRGGDLSGWGQEVYMPLIAVKYHNNPVEMPFDFSDVLTAIAPRPLFINAPLHDQIFDVSGVRDTVKRVRPMYESYSRAGARLSVEHPNAAHSFPVEVRHRAYQFLDEWLNS